MPNLFQRARGAFAAQPRGLRLFVYGALLLAAVLAGGALTAYGGTLLVVWLWALCMGGLCLLLAETWRIAFPAEQPFYRDRAFRRAFLIGAAVGVAVIAGLVLYRRTVYGEDAINYYAKQNLLFSSFATNGFYGVHVLLESILTADYKMFMNLFISIPYLFLPRTVNSFMICYALTCFVPMWFALLAVAKRVAAAFPGVRQGAYYALCMAAMALWPMFLWPATHGMPDAFGLTFAAVILLLTADYRFDRLEPRRLVCLFAATFALVLTRRWYMFWILAYYLCYALAVLLGAARRRVFGRVLGNLLKFGIPAVICVVAPLLPTFVTALTTDYADIYGAFYGGGFAANAAAQLWRQGVLFALLCLAGLALALAKPALRGPALVVAASGVAAMAMFTRTQSLGDHQSLILAPLYLCTAFCALAAVCALRRTALARAGAGAAAVFFVLNFANALRVPGMYLSTPLLSDESLDLTRRTDLDQMRAVTDFVLENCSGEETVYINIDSDGYSGTTFAYSDPAHDQLNSMILWESSVPSTHGFPTGIWTSKYVMVTDKFETGTLVGDINRALRTDTPAAAHYAYVTEFPLANGVTLYCYQRTSPPDTAEADYFKQLFAGYDARWPELYSQRIDAFLAGQTASDTASGG
ncbi:MAG TPA: hypothetical protein H9915_00495 [Candidatus Gemmiger faecigallinarum]|nr:hypothetical protein [Candidatus Gemmiger faecigallinarum]